jgi:hypothetical protein
MKVKCLLGHIQPGNAPGKFTVFEEGTVYDLPEYDEGLFRAVYGATGSEARQDETLIDSENDEKPAA